VKYHGEWGRAALLGDELANALAGEFRCEVIVPVPLHHSRLKQRGFNQAQLIATRLERQLDLPVEPLLRRARRTGAQVHLDASKRMANVADAFVVDHEFVVNGRSILLVDDVVTTGATLSACAAALVRYGAAAVSAATLAREL
jgi:ComF family protein